MFTHLWALLPPPRTRSPPSENIKKETLLVIKNISSQNFKKKI